MIRGIGIDIIEIARIQKAVDRWGDDFLKHIFTEDEITYSKKQHNPIQHFAARFAAKEAVYKAIDNNRHPLSWKDIEILNDSRGKPYCMLNTKDFNQDILISLSHSDHYAVANAIITSE